MILLRGDRIEWGNCRAEDGYGSTSGRPGVDRIIPRVTYTFEKDLDRVFTDPKHVTNFILCLFIVYITI